MMLPPFATGGQSKTVEVTILVDVPTRVTVSANVTDDGEVTIAGVERFDVDLEGERPADWIEDELASDDVLRRKFEARARAESGKATTAHKAAGFGSNTDSARLAEERRTPPKPSSLDLPRLELPRQEILESALPGAIQAVVESERKLRRWNGYLCAPHFIHRARPGEGDDLPGVNLAEAAAAQNAMSRVEFKGSQVVGCRVRDDGYVEVSAMRGDVALFSPDLFLLCLESLDTDPEARLALADLNPKVAGFALGVVQKTAKGREVATLILSLATLILSREDSGGAP